MNFNTLLSHAMLTRITEVIGPRDCRRLIVKPLMADMESVADVVVNGDTYRNGVQALKSHCRLCARCKLGKR